MLRPCGALDGGPSAQRRKECSPMTISQSSRPSGPRSRRWWLAATMAAPAAALSAACRPAAAPPQARTDIPTTYTHWYWTETRINWLKRVLEDYNKERQRPLSVEWENASTDAGQLVE